MLMTLLVKKQALTLDSDVHKLLITFHVCRRRREMYCDHPRLSACLCVSLRPHAHTIARTWMKLGGL